MKFLTKLYPHQIAAVDKLSKIKVGALYMEQGTGKTRTALELIHIRISSGKTNKVLWLCPCSVKINLREDIIFHCGEMPPDITIYGIESLSSSDNLYLQLLKLVEQYNVYLIVDESNLVKNKKAIRTARIIEISKKCKYKMILNGTPVSRTEADMFAQWYILDWRILGYQSFYSFAANHLEYRTIKTPNGGEIKTDQIARTLNVDYLTEKISPYTFQILKKDCVKLPPKHYNRENFLLTDKQKEAYKYIKYLYLEAVDEFRSETIYKLFTALQHIVSGRIVLTSPNEQMKTTPFFPNYAENPRIQKIKNIIEEKILTEKCIIFAKYQSEIDDISKLLTDSGLSWRMFTGKINQRQRQANREDFKQGVQFLLANKSCGAYGLNLQFCHNIVYYSNDFDLATRMQSEDRVHRIGQEEDVYIYDIYCPETIDQFIIDCLDKKENMVETFKKWITKWREYEHGQNLSKLQCI
ncbi:MAG: DEAD/DEAH box helicase [Selenomonadaceae bacterium]|nr:DEAD/DEAH box helicase [Selenomonadaceae bacterium]